VILLDEIEKAHPDVFNTLLQVLDDGRLTDNKGRVANFKNTIIIMTSNLGAEVIKTNFGEHPDEISEDTIDKTKKQLLELLRHSLKPEFLNRIDETIMFQPLTQANIHQIVGLQFKGIQKMLAKQNVKVTATPDAIALLAKKGYDPIFGARPVKRVIQREVLNQLSKEILKGQVEAGSLITIDVENGEFVFNNPNQISLTEGFGVN
jgi:ATP-dependent Clp protease ATP-binding subunit ClpB